jgi:ABC-type phosphate/phosphonate transport system ATPase subunit/GNAT superfamily N-acetyltransferase
LSDGQVLSLSVSSCVTWNDEVVERDGHYLVPCINGAAQILPLYLKPDTLRCGGVVLPLKIKEIETDHEYESFKQLSEFHYRGHSLHGRTSVLIATTDYPLLPAVLGYVQLATPFFMSKCRASIVNAPFADGSVSWEQWDKNASRRFINVFVRIARTVVHPEFRGLGLGQLLARHAQDFARAHWHVGKLRPLFFEIVADMLKFVPFPERAGMHFIGLTEGNLHRVAKDMAYLLGQKKKVLAGEIVREDSVGVVDLQVAYMNRAISLMRRLKLDRAALGSRLEKVERSMTLEDYEQLHSLVRLPKPSFMSGLTSAAQSFLEARLALVAPKRPRPLTISPIQPLKHSITLHDFSAHYTSFVSRTTKTQTIQKAFGVTPGAVKTTIIKQLQLTIRPKEVVLVCGASGSGKTTLVDLLLNRGQAHQGMLLEGTCFVPRDSKIGILQPVRSKLPIIQLVGGNDTHRALNVLNIAGLTEAFLYFKRFDQLSAGQQYRLMLARLIDSGANLWLADEFCSALDEVTASIVAHNLQRHARRIGATVVVAAPHFETFIRSLRPDKVLKLTSAWEWKSYNGQQFIALAGQSKLQDRSNAGTAAS